MANDIVLQNAPVTTRLMAVDDAIAVGRMALFGEKYGDEVRVVSMGDGQPATPSGWSVELCGGTHVRRTGDIGLITRRRRKRGRRRRAPHRGADRRGGAQERQRAVIQRAKAAAAELRAPLEDMPAAARGAARRAQASSERELADAKKKLAHGRRRAAAGGGRRRCAPSATSSCSARAVSGIDIKDLKSLADEGKKQLGSGVVAIVGVTEDGKAGIVVGVTDDLTARFSAVDLVRKGAEALGGKGGGGRPDMAQAGGPDGSKADAALAAVEAALGG